MNSLKIEPKIDVDEYIEKQLSPTQNDRFSRRLNKYRDHQSDCQTKNDCSFREICQQESMHVKKLQNQPKKEGKVRKVNPKSYKKKAVSVMI